ncbi:MAG: magnesium/cobalt transporter CorA [Phycisphaerales bacterium]|nr:magnesium/cobalt transporter CorA [Phycisphaerales bacterium]
MARRRKFRIARRTPPGAPPGVITADPRSPRPAITLMAYGPGGEDDFIEKPCSGPDELAPLMRGRAVTWVNVDGLGDAEVIRRIGELFGIHPLALEDIVNTYQRPKVEPYGEQVFIVWREVGLRSGELHTEQFSMVLGPNFVVSFQETAGDALDPVRGRIRKGGGRIRTRGADYLAYALLDAVVDSYYPVLEAMGERLEQLEDVMIDRPTRADAARLHDVKRDLLTLRRGIWPAREALAALSREGAPRITDETRVYLRDCLDHAVQIIDLVETYREIGSDLMDLYLSSVSFRLNEVMKLLTMVGTIFIPLTFLAGVYGMNFDTGAGPLSMPELRQPWGYAAFWIICLVIAAALMIVYRRLGWLGDGPARRRSPGGARAGGPRDHRAGAAGG